MCTRYHLDNDSPELNEIILAAKDTPLMSRFIDAGHPLVTDGEVRPTDVAPVIAPDAKGRKKVFPMQWGFTNAAHQTKLFNARTETAGTKPTFRKAWKSHRCAVPASWYYEWEHFKSPDGKIKTGDRFVLQPEGSSITWLCGLYRIEDHFPVFVILTREPSEALKKIHDRMPLILPAKKIDAWIDPDGSPDVLLEHALTDMVAEKG